MTKRAAAIIEEDIFSVLFSFCHFNQTLGLLMLPTIYVDNLLSGFVEPNQLRLIHNSTMVKYEYCYLSNEFDYAF